MSIPARLADAKKRDGLTDEQAGAKFGVKQQTFWKWRHGKQRPEEYQLPEIADWTQTDLAIIRAEWHDDRINGALSEEQAESLAEQLSMIVSTLGRVADRIEAAVDSPAGQPDHPASPRRQRVR